MSSYLLTLIVFLVVFQIVELEDLTGEEAQICSVVILDSDSDESLYDLFIEQFRYDYEEEMQDIQDTLRYYGNNGLSGNRIIDMEGESLGDSIIAICNRPNKLFRLYAIGYGDFAVIIGGGGVKDGGGDLRHYEGPREANFLIRMIKKTLDKAQECGDFIIRENGIDSKTDFIYNTEDYE